MSEQTLRKLALIYSEESFFRITRPFSTTNIKTDTVIYITLAVIRIHTWIAMVGTVFLRILQRTSTNLILNPRTNLF